METKKQKSFWDFLKPEKDALGFKLRQIFGSTYVESERHLGPFCYRVITSTGVVTMYFTPEEEAYLYDKSYRDIILFIINNKIKAEAFQYV